MLDDGVNLTMAGNIAVSPHTDVLFVGVHWGESLGLDFNITCTYAGVDMTEIANEGFGPFLNVFVIYKPDKGTKRLECIWESASGFGVAARLSVIGFTGTVSNGTVATNNGSSTTPSVSATLSSGAAGIGFYTVDLAAGASTATVGSGETSRVNASQGSGTNATRALVSTQDMGGDGVINWSLSASRTWYGVAFGINADGGDASIISNGMMKGP